MEVFFIQDLFTSLNLDDEQKKRVFLILDEKSIIPISEDEVPQKICDAQSPPVVKKLIVFDIL